MRDGGRGRAAHDGRGFSYEPVVVERVDHEEREVDAPGEIAREDGVADVAAPNRQALACTFLEV